MKTYNNIEIVTMIENGELKDNDLVFVVPSCASVAMFADNIPYIYDEQTDELKQYERCRNFTIEKETSYTVNDIHPWLMPYVEKKYLSMLFDDKCNGMRHTEKDVIRISELKYALTQLAGFASNVALYNPDSKVVLVDDIEDMIRDYQKIESEVVGNDTI